jgi:type VI secretion system protein ImpM
MTELPPGVSVGLFGKLPARGDFVREGLPRDFIEAWDDWWRRGLSDLQGRWPHDWRDAWLEAPVWRFLLPPGSCGKSAILGLWVPSVDKVGRYSPLTIAVGASDDWLPLAGKMTAFLASAEQAALDALEHDLEPEEIQRRAQGALAAADVADADPGFVAGRTAWWTEGGPRVAKRFETASALPQGNRFAAFFDDKWAAGNGEETARWSNAQDVPQ